MRLICLLEAVLTFSLIVLEITAKNLHTPRTSSVFKDSKNGKYFPLYFIFNRLFSLPSNNLVHNSRYNNIFRFFQF